jgi:hypothetical protein
MAINWGVALGKALESGLSTYERLGEEESRQMQRDKMRRELEQEKALDTAFANTQGRVGQADDYGVAIQKASGNTGMDMGQAKMLSQQGALSGGTAEDMDFERASAESSAGAMRENAARQGKVADSALPRMEAEEYTSKQAMGDYAKEAARVGGRKGALEALQMKKAFRQDDLDTQFDKTRQGYVDKLALINGTAESQGMKGLSDLANKNGLKVKFEGGKSGVGKINVLGPNGDVLETITSVGDAVTKLEQAATKQFQSQAVGLLGDEAKLLTYLNQREDIGIKREQLNVEKAYKGEGGVIDRAYQTGAKGGSGGAAAERIMKEAEKLASDKNNKFYGKKEDAYEFLKRGFNRDEDKVAWNQIEVQLRKDRVSPDEIRAERADFFGPSRGYAPPAAINVLRSGKGPNGEVLGEKDLAEFNKRYPKTPWQDIIDELPKPPQKGGLPVPK